MLGGTTHEELDRRLVASAAVHCKVKQSIDASMSRNNRPSETIPGQEVGTSVAKVPLRNGSPFSRQE